MTRTSEDILSAVLGQPAPAPRVGPSTGSPATSRPDGGDDAPAIPRAKRRPRGDTSGRIEKVTISLPAGCRRRYKIWCAEHDVTMSSVFHDYMESLVSGEGEA